MKFSTSILAKDLPEGSEVLNTSAEISNIVLHV